MKSTFVRTLLAVLAVAALMLALVTVNPDATSAANLTGGQYTYLIDGEEVTFTFDPVVRKEGVLLPIEVFQKFGIAVEGATTRQLTLKKDGVVAKVTVGSSAYDLNGQGKGVATPPLRLNGRVFLPADLLKEYGVDFSQDGNFIFLRNFAERPFEVKTLTANEWDILKTTRTINVTLRADSSIYLLTDFQLLNADMITAANLNITYGNRARLLGLLQTNTLVLVKLSNQSNKAGALVTTGTYLVDDERTQYDVQSVLDIGYGLVSNKLTQGADRMGVLVFPKAAATAKTLSLYYDNNGGLLGTFNYIK